MDNVQEFPLHARKLTEYEALVGAAPTALDAIPGAVYVCDHEGWLVRYNAEAAELWGRNVSAEAAGVDEVSSSYVSNWRSRARHRDFRLTAPRHSPRRNHGSAEPSRQFCNEIGHKRTFNSGSIEGLPVWE